MCVTPGARSPDLLELEAGADLEETRAVAEHQRDDVQFERVDESRRQVLVDDVRASADEDVLSAAASRACSRADSMPCVTKVNVVSESVNGSRS